jgi:hypothetical protein
MPDIKTALEQALAKAQTRAQLPAEWDDEGGAAVIESITTQAKEATMPKKYFETTNNVTRATFDYVFNNPGKSRKQILGALAAQGFKTGSTSSLLGQFSTQGHIVNRGGSYFAQRAEYAPLKTVRKKVSVPVFVPAPATARKKVVVSKRTGEVIPPAPAGIAALPTVREAAPQINAAWDAETLLNNLSIKQARALYDELRKIFGG